MKKHYTFVYGTLRRNEKYHHLLRGAALIADQAWTSGELFDTGCGYPAVQESESEVVHGELYLVTDEQLEKMDELEDYREGRNDNLYERKKQLIFYGTEKTEAYIYLIAQKNWHMLKTPIVSGDWKHKGKI